MKIIKGEPMQPTLSVTPEDVLWYIALGIDKAIKTKFL
jgi:hypothetical protein